MTFDSDLNPEGFDEKLSFDIKRAPVVKNLTVQAMQLLYNEASGTGGLYHGHDSFAVGGQASARLEFGRWTATPSFSILNWRYPDAILNSSAFAVAANNAGLNGNPTTTPAGGNTGPIPVPGRRSRLLRILRLRALATACRPCRSMCPARTVAFSRPTA